MEKEKVAIYKKWWFWLAIIGGTIVLILVMTITKIQLKSTLNIIASLASNNTSENRIEAIDDITGQESILENNDFAKNTDNINTIANETNINNEQNVKKENKNTEKTENQSKVQEQIKQDENITDKEKTEESAKKEKHEEQEKENSKPTVSVGKKNALSSAKQYLNYMSFSYEGLKEQLEYEGYSSEEAKYAVDNCGADWKEQAAKKAQDYLDYMSFSRSELINQLEYEGFTSSQAQYGVDKVGL